MVWNHRVMKRVGKDTGEKFFTIHEVFYEGGIVTGWTENGVAPMGFTKKELKKELKRMLDSCDSPVLDYDTGLPVTRKKDIKTIKKNLKRLIEEKEKELRNEQ